MERRAELEHPLGIVSPPAQLPPPAIDMSRLPAAPADFVLEIGTEELPPDDVVSACEQLRCAVSANGATWTTTAWREQSVRRRGLSSKAPAHVVLSI